MSEPAAPAVAEPPAAPVAAPVAAPAPLGNALADAAVPPVEGDAPPADVPPAEEIERVGAPEAYEFTPPEGQELNADQFAEWQDKAKAAGLTQKQFAALTADAVAMVNAMHGKTAEGWNEVQRGWLGEIAADREIAGAAPGTLNDAAREASSRVIAAYGGDALKQALIVTGAGNHPAVVKAFVAIGKAMAEERNVSGTNAPQRRGETTLADLYPSMA